ncbi:type VI immunity family protein [Pseudomonas aeruginosa]
MLYPYIAGDAEDSRPAPYVLLNHALKGIRYETIGSLHGGSHRRRIAAGGLGGRSMAETAGCGRQRTPRWRDKLLNTEPCLDATNSLPERP